MLSADVTGFDELQIYFDRLIDLTDVEKVLDEAGAILLNRIRTRFLAETDPDGKRWAPSRAAEERRTSGRGGGTLFDTGALFHSIQLANRGPGVRAIQTDVPYGIFHQEGMGRDKRVFLGFSDDDASVVEKLLVARLEKA